MNLSTRPLAQNVTQGRGLEKDDNLKINEIKTHFFKQ